MKQAFISTRGYAGDETFLDVVRLGLAPDGGLFVPAEIGSLTLDELRELLAANYQMRAAAILQKFPLGKLTSGELADILSRSYDTHFSDGAIAPVISLSKEQHLLELFHGPTAAFKDLALQCTPKLFTRAIKGRDETYCILAATSGDTGVATIAGYAQESDAKVMVLYPAGGVSPVQEAQMLALQNERVRVCAIAGDFDYCQRTVKQIFFDKELAQKLGNIKLSSANSINWGRLLPQVAYWVSAYLDLVHAQKVMLGDPIDITVPTGNFGNILAAHYAKLLGLPLRHFIVASNENNALTDFIQTGTLDLRDRQLQPTTSPSIDILISSNAERLLYLMSNGNTARVAALQTDLAETKLLQLNADELAIIQKMYRADFCSEEDCQRTIADTFAQTGYLLDTHTAIAKKVADEQQEKNIPMLIAATAHWAKFPTPVAAALGIDTAAKTVAELYTAILTKNPTPGMHRDLVSIHSDNAIPPTALPADYSAIIAALKQFVR